MKESRKQNNGQEGAKSEWREAEEPQQILECNKFSNIGLGR